MTGDYEYRLKNTEKTLEINQNYEIADHGYTLWDSSLVLCSAIEHKVIPADYFNNKRILEIGAGCALPSLLITATMEPSHVYVTDINSNLIKLSKSNFKRNIDLNGDKLITKVEFMVLDVTDASTFTNLIQMDLIVFSDLLYKKELYPKLVECLIFLTLPNTKVLFSYEKRDFEVELEFFKIFSQYFRFKALYLKEGPYQSDDIYLFEGWRK